MFSPGALNSQNLRGVRLGGVSSHADLSGRCSACHVPAWSQATMADRCLDCHTRVRDQLTAARPLHGRFPNGMECRHCHTEHNGEASSLTSLARFDHSFTHFPLTGRHRTIACAQCHTKELYQGTSKDCASCHSSPPSHKERSFSTQCGSCHSTATWRDATFAHTFPLDHHNKRQSLACATCHVAEDNYRTYTCYGCHAHQPDKMERKHARLNVASLTQCARCHPTGREHKRGKEAHEAEKRDREMEKLQRDLDKWLKKKGPERRREDEGRDD
jgi:hypothetical protein